MRFLLGDGRMLQVRLQDFPWSKIFLPSKLLVVGIGAQDNAVAACGIRSILNVLTLYVRKQHRGRGLGRKTLAITIDGAKRLRFRFILLGAYADNPSAYNLYSAVGFKEIVHIKRPDMRFMMLPLSFEGELVYAFLNAACSWLPKSLLSGFAQWFEARTISDSAD